MRPKIYALFESYHYRNMRKMCTIELLGSHKLSSFQSLRREEVGLLIDNFRAATKNGPVVVDLSSGVYSFNANMVCRMLFGEKYVDEELDERGLKLMIQEVLKLAGIPNLADFIPYLGPLDLQGLNRSARSIGQVFHTFFDKIIDQHLEFKRDSKAFIDINRPIIKSIILDLFLAAADTSAITIEWGLSELIKHPHVIKKLQEELKKVVGLNRMVEESDLSQLKYLDMVVKETLRLHPPGPLLAPHESSEDCTINNFYISKNSRIIVNAWAIGRDPSVWIDAEKFFPERFIGSEMDVDGKGFQMIPFGFGRRSCPGKLMGLNIINLVLANLVHCFDLKLLKDIMLTEFGLTCPCAKHLMATLSYRLTI